MNAFELEIMASHAVRVDEGRFMVFACMKRSFYETALFFGYRLLRIIRYDTMFMSSQLHKRLPLHYFRQQRGVRGKSAWQSWSWGPEKGQRVASGAVP